MSTSIKVVQFFNYPVHPAAALTKYFSEHVKMQKKTPKNQSSMCTDYSASNSNGYTEEQNHESRQAHNSQWLTVKHLQSALSL